MGVLNLPNILTITRIVIVPIFIAAIIYKHYNYALYLFLTAALTDILDGLLARLRNQKTAVGTFLDPLADKFLLITAFIILSIYGWIPKWLTVIVISRDIIVIIGRFLLYLITDTPRVGPTVLGKITMWAQSILIVYVLMNLNLLPLPDIFRLLQWATAGLTILSGLHYIYYYYIYRGLKLTHAG